MLRADAIRPYSPMGKLLPFTQPLCPAGFRADAIRPYSCGGTARTMPVDSLEKILCRISIAIIRIFRYNRKDTRQVYAGGLWGVLRRLFVMI